MISLAFPGNWKIFMNGVVGDLFVESIIDDVVSGSIGDPENPPQALETATWNEAAKQIQFARTLRKNTPTSEYQAFTGYLYDYNNDVSDNIEVQAAGHDYTVTQTLAGKFTSEPYESRPDFGWFAFSVFDVIT